MMGNSVPSAKAVNAAARLRWHDLSARVRRHVKRQAVVNLALRNQRRILEPTNNLASLSSLERLNFASTFEQEVLDAVEELKGEAIYEAQKHRASRKRPKMIGEDGERPLTVVISELIHKPEHRDSSPREIWPHFCDTLRELRCRPMECIDPGDFRKTKFRFLTENSSRKQKHAELTFARFETIVGGLRKSNSK